MLSPKQIGTICFAIFSILISAPLFATAPDIDTATASCSDDVFNSNTGPVNIEVNWEPNDITLHWYNGNTEIQNVPVASQSCTYDGTLTPPTTIPTKTGYTFKGWRAKHLPAGYTKLQYIESTGTQYINTGYSPNSDTKVEIKIRLYQNAGGYPMAFGAFDNDGRTHYALYGHPTNKLYYTFGLNSSNNDNDIKTNYLASYSSFSTDYTCITEKNTLIVDGISYTMGANPTFSISNPLYLFARNLNGSPNILSSGRIYYTKIWENGTFVRNFIPAKRDSDNVVGLWDTVSETFFTNSGSGIFTAGPVVQ